MHSNVLAGYIRLYYVHISYTLSPLCLPVAKHFSYSAHMYVPRPSLYKRANCSNLHLIPLRCKIPALLYVTPLLSSHFYKDQCKPLCLSLSSYIKL